jgi:hypothetical protein
VGLIESKHYLGDKYAIVLSNERPSGLVAGDVRDLAPGGGYTGGGWVFEFEREVTADGATYLRGVEVTITASGGEIGPFRYAVLINYESQALCFAWDYGRAIQLRDGVVQRRHARLAHRAVPAARGGALSGELCRQRWGGKQVVEGLLAQQPSLPERLRVVLLGPLAVDEDVGPHVVEDDRGAFLVDVVDGHSVLSSQYSSAAAEAFQ